MQYRMRVASLFTAALLGTVFAISASDDSRPNFKITTKRDSDKVEVRVEKGQTVFLVHSPFGISQATIERKEAKWPKDVILRLYLKGLESFRASNGTITLHAAVSSHNDRQRVRLWQDAKENAPLDSSHPLWTEIRMVDADGKPAQDIPLKEGYFDIPLPRALFVDNSPSITLQWIDFYRN
jgi:hypothetical protein